MPLEKQYDRSEVLEKATRAFWSHGYEATSISDLVAQTGLNRASLYNAFEGKRGLFIECLAHYDGKHRAEFLDRISQDNGPREAILAAFEAAARPDAGADLPPGCLLVNSALGLSPHDPEIRAIVNRSLTEVEAFFARSIRTAAADGSVPAGIDVEAAAKALLGLFLGLRVMVRSEFGDTAVSAVIDQARSVLG